MFVFYFDISFSVTYRNNQHRPDMLAQAILVQASLTQAILACLASCACLAWPFVCPSVALLLALGGLACRPGCFGCFPPISAARGALDGSCSSCLSGRLGRFRRLLLRCLCSPPCVVALIPLLAWWLFSLPGVLALIQLLAWWLFSLAGVVALFMLLLGAPQRFRRFCRSGRFGRFWRFLPLGAPRVVSLCSGWLQQAKPVVTIVPNNPGALNACRTGEGALLLATALSRCDRHPPVQMLL